MSSLCVRGHFLTFQEVSYRCSVGRNGFTASKREGDGCTPLGSYCLREIFYRSDRVGRDQLGNPGLPVRALTPQDGWCDDPASSHYNRWVDASTFCASHEKLWRQGQEYDLLIVVGYNDAPLVPGRGSAIFIHVAKPDYEPTSGCVALASEDFLKIIPCLRSDTSLFLEGPGTQSP